MSKTGLSPNWYRYSRLDFSQHICEVADLFDNLRAARKVACVSVVIRMQKDTHRSDCRLKDK